MERVGDLKRRSNKDKYEGERDRNLNEESVTYSCHSFVT